MLLVDLDLVFSVELPFVFLQERFLDDKAINYALTYHFRSQWTYTI